MKLADMIRDDDFYDRIDCPAYCNDGIIVVCCDDLCANTDYCIHGDGYAVCPDCNGRGWVLAVYDEKEG